MKVGCRQNQKGLTLISWLVVLSVIGLLFTLSLRLFSPYMEGYLVKQILESLAQEPGIKKKPTAKIEELLKRRFEVNNIKGVQAKDLVITQENGSMSWILNYESRVHAIANIDAVVKFENTVNVP